MEPYQYDRGLLEAHFQTNLKIGLPSDEIPKRRESKGSNVLPDPPKPSLLVRFLSQFRSPLIYLLVIAALLIGIVGKEAIDALPMQGGVVVIPPRTYVLRRSVALRRHVRLQGAGSTTVLTRGQEAVTKLREPARKGDTVIAVESVEGFRVGVEFFVRETTNESESVAGKSATKCHQKGA